MVPEQLTSWWYSFLSLFDTIPEKTIAIIVYVGGTLIALWCWSNIARRLPSPLGGITWIILFACLATPTVSQGQNAELAPAIIGLIFGVLTKEQPLIWANLASIGFVAGIGFLVAYCWTRYKYNRDNVSNTL